MASVNPSKTAGVDALNQEYSWFGDFMLTKKCSLIGGVELTGRDPDGLNEEDFLGLTALASRFFSQLDSNIIITQYFSHFDGAEITIRPRSNKTCNLLSKRRESFLNKQKLSSTSLVFLFEIMPDEKVSQLGFFDFIKHSLKSVGSASSRQILKDALSKGNAIVYSLKKVLAQQELLQETLTDFIDDWDSIVNPRLMSKKVLYSFSKFIVNLNPHYLSDEFRGVEPPEERLDVLLADGDRSLVSVNNVEYMKLAGDITSYVRILSVNSLSSKTVAHGLWALKPTSPARQKGNYVIMARFQPFSQFQRSTLFLRKEADLNRRNTNLLDAISGRDKDVSEIDRRELMKPAIREALTDLGEAENLDVSWGFFHSSIILFGSDLQRLGKEALKMKRACDRAGISSCWEDQGLLRAYKTFMPAGRSYSLRDIYFNSSQASAASLLYAPVEGQRFVEDLPGEECQYVFTSSDGSPFYFSPFVNERCVVIGIGPIRSGKSFLKTALATHFLKYGGSIHGIDIDQGLETLARVFKEEGGIFRSEDDTGGFNPFVSCRSKNDLAFSNHLTQLIIQMVKLNETIEMQTITAEEQQSLDKAIQNTMAIDSALQNFRSVWRHCSGSLRDKLERWVTNKDGVKGVYSKYFDVTHDCIGGVDKKVMAYNLKSIKDDKKILPLIMAELFFRTTRIFEDTTKLHVPNYLDIDEFHALTNFDYVTETITRSVRTWGKYKGGIGMWSQGAKDFASLKEWSALRSAASTLFFMSDTEMVDKEYMDTFLLTQGECDAIRTLRPKREVYIIQRGINVSKKLIVSVEPEQHVISTSKATETAIRAKNFNDIPNIEDAIIQTATDIGLYEKVQFNRRKEDK